MTNKGTSATKAEHVRHCLAHLGLLRQRIGLDEDLSDGHLVHNFTERLFHGEARPHDGHATQLHARKGETVKSQVRVGAQRLGRRADSR